MTVKYNGDGGFYPLLLRWRGSIYKILYREFLLYFGSFYALNYAYRFCLTSEQKVDVAKMAAVVNKVADYIPLIFILGFYVNSVVKRWWEQFTSLPSADKLAQQVQLYIEGDDSETKLLRRTILRYVNVSAIIGLHSMSEAIRNRYPSIDSLVDFGLMTQTELDRLNAIDSPYPKFWIPCHWAAQLLVRAKKDGKIDNIEPLVDEINSFKENVETLTNYDWVNVPLVYTQVVTIAVSMFFGCCLFGRCCVDYLTLPIQTIIQFVFYVGWLKVAESHLNTVGMDDDDFEIMYVLDKNLQLSYTVADLNDFDLSIDDQQDQLNYPHK